MFQELIEKHRAKVAALMLVALPLGLIVTGDGTNVGGRSRAPARLARAGIGFGQLTGVQIIGGAGSLIQQWLGSDLAAKNKELQLENERLREEKSRLIGVLQENARLRKLVGFKLAHPEYDVVPAKIVSRNTTPYFRVMTIKIKANTAKIKPRMPVVVAQGVVGMVHKVNAGFAEVIVLSDPRSRLDTISQRNRAHGVVRGLGHDRDYDAQVSYLSERDQVRLGDVMVTSGMGGVFPRELVVGTVTKVTEGERGLFQHVVLEPAVDLSRVEEVFVVTHLNSQAKPEPEQDE